MEGISGLYFVPGVDMNELNSFPSGHTTAAFSLYTLLALLLGRKQYGWVWVVLATLVGLSRVYLLQHFWMDILAGAMIGTFFSTLLFAAYKTFNSAQSS
jgi:membrane-associated phospholipid phosphatase